MPHSRGYALWLKPRPHTLPLATPLLHYLATVRLSFWAQVVSFGNFCWSQLCATILVFVWITISSPAGRFFLAGGPHFVTIFGPSFGHRFWSLFWAPSCPQIQRLLMNRLFVAQFWHQIWSPKREPKTTNFLPRNPDTFQPNFEQNLTKKSKKLERRKRYCKYPKKRHDHVLQTGSTSWPPSRRLRGILTARKRNTHPLALRVTTMVRHVLELVWVPVSGTYPGLIKLLPSVSHASRWQANATNRKQRAPAQKRDEQSFRWKGADCGICSAIEYAARRIRNASGAESSTGAVPLRAPRALSARGARCVARPTLKLKLEVKLFCETRARCAHGACSVI